MNKIKEILENRSKDGVLGLGSYCTANPLVLEAVMEEAVREGVPVLVEATSNQVNQLGGYTGMQPADYMAFVRGVAEKTGLPEEDLLVGGDHLGPLVWRGLPAETAMANAYVEVRDYAAAGYQKIHLDTSMKLGGDDPDAMLPTKTIAERGAFLYGAVLEGYAEYAAAHPDAPFPVIIIGSEVPIPGGATEAEDSVSVTKPADFRDTVETYRAVFTEAGYADAFEHIVAVVVQPGVEFGDADVIEYDREAAADLIRAGEETEGFFFEGHSTDYQNEEKLREMAEDGIVILKVGPALTYGLREALFQLEAMEKELVAPEAQSHFADTLEKVMLEDPKNWAAHYHGTEKELRLKRKYSYSDRARYYIGKPEVTAAMERLFANIDAADVAPSMLHQFMPYQYEEYRRGRLQLKARELAKYGAVLYMKQYQRAVGML